MTTAGASKQILTPVSIINGSFAVTYDYEEFLRERLRSAIGTQIGERVMRPTYGIDILPYAFEGLDDHFQAAIKAEILRAAQQAAPDITITDVDMVPDLDNGALLLTVQYHIGDDVQRALPVATPLVTI